MRRILAGLLVLALAVAGVAAVVLVLQSRDDAEVASEHGPGEKVTERCPERRAPVTRDARELSAQQIAYEAGRGNVVLVYGGPRPPAPLRELQEELTGPFDAEVAAAGQAVILARRPGAQGVEAIAWEHRLRASDPADRQLRLFAEAHLGEGSPRSCPTPA